MRADEMLPLLLDSTREVVDVTPDGTEFQLASGLPETVGYRRVGAAAAAEAPVGPDTLVVAVVGPHPDDHVSPDKLVPVLCQLRPEGRAVIFTAWPIAYMSYQRLAGPLTEAGCRVTAARVVDDEPAGIHAALAVERVAGADRPANATAGDPDGALRQDNQSMLARFVADSLAAKLAGVAERLFASRDQLTTVKRRLSRTNAKLAALESSVALQLGQILVDGFRHPLRGAVTVPRDIARLARRRRNESAADPQPPVVTDRVVRFNLPATGAAPGRWLVLTAPRDMIVPRRLDKGGLAQYEPDAMACFLAATDVAGPGAVLDIGANVGIFAAVASAMTEREVRAFEPAPKLVAVARRFAQDNKLAWLTETVALGAENGTATFYLSDSSDSSNSLAEGFRPSSARLTVEVETLDSYLSRTGLVPAVLKIDTETTEPDVIAGAAETIAKYRPWIVCEVLANRVEERLTEAFLPYGYHWYQIRDEIPYSKAYAIVGDTTQRHLNWLFAPEEPDERFWAAVRERFAGLSSCTVDHADPAAAGPGQG
jgi:FkbM family methyltransferase